MKNKTQANGCSFPGRPVLVVDDNLQLLRIIRQKLEYDQFFVEIAGSGEEAKTLIEAGLRPGVVLTDAVMPGDIQGQDLATYVKSTLPSVPVLMMSGYVDAAQVRKPGGIRIDGFFPKPIKLSEISARIGHFIGDSKVSLVG